jgi:DNA-binding response OmpR family regulator
VRVLIAEDDVLLGQGLLTALRRHGYGAERVGDGGAALAALASEDFDLLVLDLGLPKQDGYAVLRELRGRGASLPVLILTARDEIGDRVRGLDLGADDYLVKPFDLRELLARLRALERRIQGRPFSPLQHGELAMDLRAMTVRWQGRQIDLPRREFMLLRCLLENLGRVMTRDALIQQLYGWEEDVSSNTLEVHIHHLRRKLSPELIRTVRGIGYAIDSLPSSAAVGG